MDPSATFSDKRYQDMCAIASAKGNSDKKGSSGILGTAGIVTLAGGTLLTFIGAVLVVFGLRRRHRRSSLQQDVLQGLVT